MELTRAQKAARTRKRNEWKRRQVALDAEANAVHKQLQDGRVLQWTKVDGYYGYRWHVGAKKSDEVIRQDVITRLKQMGLVKSGDHGFVLLSSPEEYGAKQAERDRHLSANRRRRLDRWTKAIADAAGVTIEPGKIDEPLLEIASEMETGMMDDE